MKIEWNNISLINDILGIIMSILAILGVPSIFMIIKNRNLKSEPDTPAPQNPKPKRNFSFIIGCVIGGVILLISFIIVWAISGYNDNFARIFIISCASFSIICSTAALIMTLIMKLKWNRKHNGWDILAVVSLLLSFIAVLWVSYFPNLLPFGTKYYYDQKGFLGMYSTTGTGKIIFHNGDVYEGEIVNRQPSGFGKYIHNHEDGWVYEGMLLDGIFNGKGKVIYNDGAILEGEFLNDEPNGQGTHTYANGDKYVGEFKDGLRNGQGTLTWADSGTYVGEWKDGEPNGQGTLTWADGTVQVGMWEDGKFIG